MPVTDITSGATGRENQAGWVGVGRGVRLVREGYRRPTYFRIKSVESEKAEESCADALAVTAVLLKACEWYWTREEILWTVTMTRGKGEGGREAESGPLMCFFCGVATNSGSSLFFLRKNVHEITADIL